MAENCVVSNADYMYDFGYLACQGTRKTMEDYLSITGHILGDKHSALFAIYDGHGGSNCSQYCSEHFSSIFASKYKQNHNVLDIINSTITDVNQECMSKWPEQGTTLSLLFCDNNDITIANLGDSKVMLFQKGQKPVCATVDHRISNKVERDLVEKRNKWAIYADKICGRLSLSRCIGDKPYDDCLSREPNVYKLKKEKGLRIVMASDGIWDFVREEEINKIVWSCNSPVEASKQIKNAATRRFSRDNMSVIVIFF